MSRHANPRVVAGREAAKRTRARKKATQDYLAAHFVPMRNALLEMLRATIHTEGYLISVKERDKLRAARAWAIARLTEAGLDVSREINLFETITLPKGDDHHATTSLEQ